MSNRFWDSIFICCGIFTYSCSVAVAAENVPLTVQAHEIQCALPVPGTVAEMNVSVGQTVRTGQLLLRLNTKAALRTWKQATELYQSQIELAELGNAYRFLELRSRRAALVDAAANQVRAAGLLYDLHHLRAPVDAVVKEIQVKLGDRIRDRQPAVTLYRLDQLYVLIEAPWDRFDLGAEIPLLVQIAPVPDQTGIQEEPQYQLIRGRVTGADIPPLMTANTALQGLTGKLMVALNTPSGSVLPEALAYLPGSSQFEGFVQANPEALNSPDPTAISQPFDTEKLSQFMAAASPENAAAAAASKDNLDASKLSDALAALPDQLQASLSELAVAVPELQDMPELVMPQLPQALLDAIQNRDLETLPLDVDFLAEALGMSAQERAALENLQYEIQRVIDEEGIDVDYLDDLMDIEGVAEYKKFLVGIKAFDSSFARSVVQQMSEGEIAALEDQIFLAFGLPAVFDPEFAETLELSQAQLDEVREAIAAHNTIDLESLKTLFHAALNNGVVKEHIVDLIKSRNSGDNPTLADRLKQPGEEDSDSAGMSASSTGTGETAAGSDLPEELSRRNRSRDNSARPLSGFRNVPESERRWFFMSPVFWSACVSISVLVTILSYSRIRNTDLRTILGFGRKQKSIRTLVVGPEAPFQRINDAIEFALMEFDDPKPPRRDRVVIRIEPAVYAESVRIEHAFPCPLELRAAGNGSVILEGLSDVGIFASGIRGFSVSGLEFRGTFTSVIELADCQNQISLTQLKMDCDHDSGIRVTNSLPEGALDLRIRNLHYQGQRTTSSAIDIEPAGYAESKLSVDGCRFLGPCDIAVHVRRCPMTTMLIQRSVFYQLRCGVSFISTTDPFQNLTVQNNSFFDLDHAVLAQRVFDFTDTGKQIQFYNNLFAEIRRGEFSLAKETDLHFLREFSLLLVRSCAGNLTSSPFIETVQETRLPIFQETRSYSIDFDFISTDPSHQAFLIMGPQSTAMKSAWSKGTAEPYVGAHPTHQQMHNITVLARNTKKA